MVFVSYPGNAQFDAAVGDGANQAAVRAEYWNGHIATLTAGSQGITVTTDQNPNGIRAIRLCWLRPGAALRLFVSGSIVLGLGAFVAGVCLISQPARVALVAASATPITLGLTGLLWLALWPWRRSRARLLSTVR